MSAAARLRVLIIDDHRLVREGMRATLERCGTVEVVAEAAEAKAGIAAAARLAPRLVILDLEMPGLHGLQALRRLSKAAPRAAILIVTASEDPEQAAAALAAGAAGYLLKADSGEELLAACVALAAGRRYISPVLAPQLLERQALGAADPLTPREREVLRLIAQGGSAKTIAAALDISPKTVQIHRGNLAAKLKLRSTAALVRYALKHKLITPS